MLSYRDKVFCSSDCTNRACHRYFTPDDENRASQSDLPVAWSDYSGVCRDYRPPQDENEDKRDMKIVGAVTAVYVLLCVGTAFTIYYAMTSV
jgi:hypothetical protein